MSHPLIYGNRDCQAWFDDLLRLVENSIKEPRTVFDRSHTPWVICTVYSKDYPNIDANVHLPQT